MNTSRAGSIKHVQCNFVVFFGCDRTSSEKQRAGVRLSGLNRDNAVRQQTSRGARREKDGLRFTRRQWLVTLPENPVFKESPPTAMTAHLGLELRG